MMDLFEAIIGRRSIRRFSSQPVEFEKLMMILDSARYAPSPGNLQNWKFILITEKEKIRGMFDYCLQQDAFNTAQAAVIVCSESSYVEKFYGLRGKRLYALQSCSAAIQNILLTAHDLELGSLWVGAFDEDAISNMFDIPEDIRPQAIILLGYPDEIPEDKDMKSLSEKVYFNKWNNKLEKPHLMLYNISDELERRAKRLKELAKEKAKGLKAGLPSKEEVKKTAEKLKKKLNEGMKKLKEDD